MNFSLCYFLPLSLPYFGRESNVGNRGRVTAGKSCPGRRKGAYSRLNIIARNFSFQFKVCQHRGPSKNSFPCSSLWGLPLVCERWKNVIQGSGYGKLFSPKHNLRGHRSIVSLLCRSCLEKNKVLKSLVQARMPQLFNLPLREGPRLAFEIIAKDNKEYLTIESNRAIAGENSPSGQGWTGAFGSHLHYF